MSTDQRANPDQPSHKNGDTKPSPSAENSPETMHKPVAPEKRQTHEAGKQTSQERTIGNHPADPNRTGADWNLLPPGISDEDARDPGGMEEKPNKPHNDKK